MAATCNKKGNFRLLSIFNSDERPYFHQARMYDSLNDWIKYLDDHEVITCAYMFLPNELSMLIYCEENCDQLNNIVTDLKSRINDEVNTRLKLRNPFVRSKELIAQHHELYVIDSTELVEKLDQLHAIPTTKKWEIVEDATDYPYSSAQYYELGEILNSPIRNYRDLVIQ